jgi:hypothetical protein
VELYACDAVVVAPTILDKTPCLKVPNLLQVAVEVGRQSSSRQDQLGSSTESSAARHAGNMWYHQ